MEETELAYQIRVVGKVQGVWFRASTKKKAEELGIRGFVKNHPDGSVYIEAEGNKEQLDIFIDWCHQGPIYAKVQAVHAKSIDLKDYKGFEVLK